MNKEGEPTKPSGDDPGGSSDSEPESGSEEPKKEQETRKSSLVHEEKESFASKFSYILVLVGYAVGLGNIWRFPYVMQENGGVLFLIPFVICMTFLGIPIFILELAIGQRLRKSAIFAWLEISPYLAGLGVAAGGACFIVGYYYTTLIAWSLYYFFSSFSDPLPWINCSIAEPACCSNVTSDACMECNVTRSSTHYWYTNVIKMTRSIDDPGKFNMAIFGMLLLAWLITWAILVRGIKASGQVAYVTALLPYVVLVIFLILGFTLEGNSAGVDLAFELKWEVLYQPKTWFKAGSQVFFNFGVAFGILISFSSLLPVNNNCVRDAIYVSFINFGTSILATAVVYPTIGSKSTAELNDCKTTYKNNTPTDIKEMKYVQNIEGTQLGWYFEKNKTAVRDYSCDLKTILDNNAGGTGLIFMAYTEVIASKSYSQFWSILFFTMILTLGIDSGFTTVEGAILMIRDLNPFNLNWKKWKITTGVCVFLWVLSVVFAFGWAQYMLTYIDEFTTNWVLLIVGFFECFGIAWIYGLRRFSYDIYLMTGRRPWKFWLLCWKYISPVFMIFLFGFTLYDYFFGENALTYKAYVGKGRRDSTKYPIHAIIIGLFILVIALGSIPLFAILAKLKKYPIKNKPSEEFPEEELIAERGITDANLFRAESKFDRFLFWRDRPFTPFGAPASPVQSEYNATEASGQPEEGSTSTQGGQSSEAGSESV